MNARLLRARRLAAAAFLLALPLSPPVAAQGADLPAVGFAIDSLPYPGLALTATLSDGSIVAFDGLTVALFDEAGAHLRDLATFPSFVFGSFLVPAPDEGSVLLGESTAGGIYTVDLSAGGLRLVTTLPLDYDAAYEDAGHVLVSASTCGFGCGNELWRVDLASGAATLVANVGGASGPLVVEADGDVVYGRVSDTFALGDYRVLRFDAADLTGSPVATEADATVVGSGFDGATDLALDPVDGRIYLAEDNFGAALDRIRLVQGDAAVSPVLVEGRAGLAIGNLELLPGDGVALFRAFQPPAGGTLLYDTTDFFAVSERDALVPQRPSLSLSGPGTTGAGTVTITVADGAPQGSAYLAYGPTALFDPAELPIFLAQLGAPVFLGLDPATVALDPTPIALDAAGHGQTAFPHDGSLLGLVTAQALALDASGAVVAISGAASL